MIECKTPVTVAYGDGIGPEIMSATLNILEAAGARLEIETVDIGEKVYLAGNTAGIAPETWESLQRTKVFLKAPITTPQGGGYKSLNVTVRKTLGLYANVRPCAAYAPFVETKHPEMNLVIIRENEEDLYAGIEHRQTTQVYQCLKLMSRPGCEKIVRYGFEYARLHNRKKVSCFTKDNIMKMTDGLFHQVFEEIGQEYPELKKEHLIVDIGAAKLANTPEQFDIIILPNLYGDILSDVAAQIAGSVGLAGSANIGERVAMFEAIHGSAPDIAGQNKANPSGLIHGAIMMLVHIGQLEAAEKIHNAWLKCIEDGIHTIDIFKPGVSRLAAGTREFADAVIERIGEVPLKLMPVTYTNKNSTSENFVPRIKPGNVENEYSSVKETVGVDVFLEWTGGVPDDLGIILKKAGTDGLGLQMITNRGVKVYPDGHPETFCTDHWRCRFIADKNVNPTITHHQIINLLRRVSELGLDFIKIETLCNFDGKPGYSLGQGQ